jgi:hypothetical protein
VLQLISVKKISSSGEPKTGALVHVVNLRGYKLDRLVVDFDTGEVVTEMHDGDRIVRGSKDIICRNKNSKERQYFVNPWLFCKGNRINKVLQTMFRNYGVRVCGGIKWKHIKG